MQTIQTWADYQALAIRTASPLPHALQNFHADLGMLTEIGELADPFKRNLAYSAPWEGKLTRNLYEEVGDLCWYIALRAHNCGITLRMPLLLTGSLRPLLVKAVVTFSHILADQHEEGEYNRLALQNDLQRLLDVVYSISQLRQVKFEMCLAMNIAKLAKRYGEKFSSEAALLRNVEDEMKVLDGCQDAKEA